MNCYYCDVELVPKYSMSTSEINRKKLMRATLDHVTPRSISGLGQGDQNGTVYACERCNNDKHSLTLEEYRVVLAFRFGYIAGVNYKFPGE